MKHFISADIVLNYADLRNFELLSFYGVKSVFRKGLNKREMADGFYHLPKLNNAAFEAYVKLQPTDILMIGFVYKYLTPEFLLRLKHKHHVKLFLYDTDS